MATKTKIIVTLVPNGIVNENGKSCLHFSMHLSPRLTNTGRLKDYYEIIHWTDEFADIFKRMKLSVGFYSGHERKSSTVSAGENEPFFTINKFVPFPGSKTLSLMDVTHKQDILGDQKHFFWEKLFGQVNTVSGWVVNEGAYEIANLVSSTKIETIIKEVFDKEIELINSYADVESFNINESVFRLSPQDFIMYKSNLIYTLYDLKSRAIEDSSAFFNSLFALDSVQLNNLKVSYLPHLRSIRTQIFLALEILVRDIRKILNNTQYEEDIERENRQNGEFHQKLSILGSYPIIMRSLGWIRDYYCELPSKDRWVAFLSENFSYNSSPETRKYNGFLRIETGFRLDDLKVDDLSEDKKLMFRKFLEEVDFFKTWTYFSGSTDDFRYDYSPNLGRKSLLTNKGYLIVNERILSPSLPDNSKPLPQEVQATLFNQAQILEKIKDLVDNGLAKSSPSGSSQQNTFSKARIESSGISIKIKSLSDRLNNQVNDKPEIQQANSSQIIPASAQTNPIIPAPPNNDNTTQAITQNITEGYIIYGHHLDAGYRVDLAAFVDADKPNANNGSPLQFLSLHSLCKRNSLYQLAEKYDHTENKIISQALHKERISDEGWISESAQRTVIANLVNVDEDLFRWNGWSLVCPMPGSYNKITALGEEYKKPEVCHELVVDSIPTPCSLTPIRFGNSYSFRLRTVDICGNGPVLLPDDTDANPDIKYLKAKLVDYNSSPDENTPRKWNSPYWTKPLKYLRTEGVDAPSLFFPMPSNEPLKDDLFKKDPATLVVRTAFRKRIGTETDWVTYDLNPKGDIRCLAPPQVNFHFVESHGVLDEALGWARDKEVRSKLFSFQTVKGRKDDTARPLMACPGEPIPFFYDPTVCRYVFYQENIGLCNDELPIENEPETTGNQRYIRSYLTKQGTDIELGASFVLLRLKASNPNAAGATIQVTPGKPFQRNRRGQRKKGSPAVVDLLLVPGEEYRSNDLIKQSSDDFKKQPSDDLTKQLLIYCSVRSQELSKFSKVERSFGIDCTKKTDNSDIKQTIDDISQLSTPLRINLIHAVNKPCLVHQRFSSDKNDIFREHILAKEITLIERQFEETDVRFSLTFDTFPCLTTAFFNLVAVYDELIIDRCLPDGYQKVEVHKAVLKDLSIPDYLKDLAPYIKEKEFKLNEKCLNHSLLDTRHRWVNYQLEAVSKFKDYFIGLLPEADYSVFGELPVIAQATESLKMKNGRCWINIKSTKNPSPLTIDTIMPLISWHEESPKSLLKRYGNAFRIYFKDDWFSSGEGEQVAVFFEPTRQIYSDYLEKFLSQIGLDPTVKTGIDTKLQINDSFFLPNDFFTNEIVSVPESNLVIEPTNNPSDKINNLKAAIYNVKFCPQSGRWYTEITTNTNQPDSDYFLFIKFALGRYQANSIKNTLFDARFSSKITTTDFVQCLPYRQIKVDHPNHKITYGWYAMKDKNEIYLITESDSEDLRTTIDWQNSAVNVLEKVTTNNLEKVKRDGDLYFAEFSFNREAGLPLPSCIYIEEYECFESPDITLDPEVQKWPRQDYTKRLVCHYKIINLNL